MVAALALAGDLYRSLKARVLIGSISVRSAGGNSRLPQHRNFALGD
jgi:hypothetical protein